ncbi:hypothetical protein [Bacillus cereus]|nr:hypothetical protein [Bacillus cereus]
MPEFERLDPPASGGSGGKHKPKFDKKTKDAITRRRNCRRPSGSFYE